MSSCRVCEQEMQDNVSCSLPIFTDFPDGIPRERLRFGQEPEDWGAKSGKPCSDCGCPPDGFHHLGCDVEHCPLCKEQLLTCDCDDEDGELLSMPIVDWHPLEEFFGAVDAPELGGFMYMRGVHVGKYGRVHEYKHVDTRCYLMISDTGRLFAWSPERMYFPISRKQALERVYDGIEYLYLSRPGSLPRREIYECERNRPGAESEAS